MEKLIKLYLFIVFCCSITQMNAQTKRWSLENCIDYALKNNIELKQKQKEIDVKEIELNTSKNSWLPNLNAGIQQNFDFGQSPSVSGSYISKNSANTSFGIQVNMPLFDGFKIANDIGARKLYLLAGVESLKKAKEDITIAVTSLYLQALYNKEIMRISKLQVSLSDEKVRETNDLVEMGKLPLAQLYDIKAQLAKDKVTLAEAQHNVELSLLDLAQLLEIERSEPNFDIVVPQISNAIEKYMSSIIPPDHIYNNAISFKPHIKEQEYLLESQKKMLKVAQSGYYPLLEMNLNYVNGYYYYFNNDKNLSFHDQMKNNDRQTIGFTLTIPIFNRFAIRNNVREMRVNISNQELVIENTKKNLYKEIQQAYISAIGAQEKYKASEESVVASKESLIYAEERYMTGRISVFEYNESKTKYAQSLSERAQSKYEYIFRSKILDFYNGVPITL